MRFGVTFIFAGYNYYPDGGSKDINCFCDSIDEAKNIAIGLIKQYEWVEVYDLHEQKCCFYFAEKRGSIHVLNDNNEWVEFDE